MTLYVRFADLLTNSYPVEHECMNPRGELKLGLGKISLKETRRCVVVKDYINLEKHQLRF